MSEPHAKCPQCGGGITPQMKFCGQCGLALSEGGAPPGGPAPGAAGKRTMVGMTAQGVASTPSGPANAPDDAAQAAPQAPSSGGPSPSGPTPPKRPNPKGTLLGMPAVGGTGAPADAPPQSPAPPGGDPSAAPPQPAPAPSPEAGTPEMNRTLLGMPAGASNAGAGATGGSPPAGPPAASPQGGEPTPQQGGAAPSGQAPAAAPHAPSNAASPPSAQPQGMLGPSQRTMLGQPRVPEPAAAQAPPAQPAAAPPQSPAPGSPPAGTERYAPAMPQQPQRERVSVHFDEPTAGGVAGLGRKRRGPLLAVLSIGAVLVAMVVVAAAAWLLFSGGDPKVRTQIVQTGMGEALQVEVPGAAEATKVRFEGREEPLESGRAHFPLAADDLHLGDNELTLDVIGPDGDARRVDVTLTVDYRVRADLSGLEQSPPAIAVHVDAPRGSQVTLDGEAITLDRSGHAQQRFELDPREPSGPNPVLEHTVRYTIEPPEGEPAEGRVRTQLPYTSLQVDRPADEVITDADAIDIAGAVHASAKVTVDGEPVEVNDGRFLHRYPLPDTGTYEPVLVARQSERAPRRRTLQIRRVADLEAEAEAFDPDPELTYARLVENPSIYRGRKAEFVGRVYNVDVHDGQGVLQMLVRDCPGRQRCPLWVTYPAAREPELNSWVRVLGHVAGEQQYRSRSGDINTDPRVDATFVLPVGGN